MGNTILEIGCDGGTITIQAKGLHGVFFFELTTFEHFEGANNKKQTFISLKDAWNSIEIRYQKWHHLYPIQISKEMIDLIKDDYLKAKDKNEYTQDVWMRLLANDDLAF